MDENSSEELYKEPFNFIEFNTKNGTLLKPLEVFFSF